jgi:parvulin-like peptidyl-prolyl isomerase
MNEQTMIAFRFLLVMALACLVTSCGRKEKSEAENNETSRVIATVGDERITAAEFEAEWNRRSFGNMPADDLQAARSNLLNEMIRTKAALVRARESGFDERTDTRLMVENLIASRYREEMFAKHSSTDEPIPAANISTYYSNNLSRFTVPAAARAGIITLKASSKADDPARETFRALAESLRERAAQSTDAEFHQLVRQYSLDQSTRYIGGDTGWIETNSVHSSLPASVLEAIFSLQSPGNVAPMIESPEAFFVIRLTDRREAAPRPLAEVEPTIRYDLAQLQRREQEQAFLRELTNGLPIEINQSALDQFQPPAPVNPATPPALPAN